MHASKEAKNTVPSERYFSKVGTVAAFSGIVVYGAAQYFHPWTPPHETEAAFADYPAVSYWPIIHLGELLGILLMATAVLAVA